jgi:hypothetical protein
MQIQRRVRFSVFRKQISGGEMKRTILICCAVILAVVTSYELALAEEVPLKTFITTDVTDLWWNPNESGWGMQANQSGSTVFVTIFVYGSDHTPRWFVAQLSLTGGVTFTGPVYVVSGPYYGLPSFNPAQVSGSQVGTMTFVLDTVSTVVVSKNIERQPLTLEPIGGSYFGGVNLTASSCANSSANVQTSGAMALILNQSGNSISGSFQLVGTSAGAVCNIVGTYTEAGRMGTITTTYSCASGEVGNMRLVEVTNRIGMISGRLSGQSTNLGCAYSGRFSVINPLVP